MTESKFYLSNVKGGTYDSSSIKDFCMCPRRGYYRWIAGYTPKRKSAALVFGGAIHAGLDKWYRTHDKVQAVEAFRLGMVDCPEDDKRTIEKGELMLNDYTMKYAHEPFTVLDVEVNFALSMPNDTVLAGRMDLIIQWDDFLYGMEHKTTSRLGNTFFLHFRPDLQIDIYCYAVRQLKGSCDGCIINALQVAKTRQGLERDISSRGKAEIDRFERQYILITNDIKERLSRVDGDKQGVLKEAFYQNLVGCHLYGECPYKELCLFDDDPKVIESRFDVTDGTRSDQG